MPTYLSISPIAPSRDKQHKQPSKLGSDARTASRPPGVPNFPFPPLWPLSLFSPRLRNLQSIATTCSNVSFFLSLSRDTCHRGIYYHSVLPPSQHELRLYDRTCPAPALAKLQ
ncbi:hypothetical protein CBS147320_9313 [Aspergillus niger]|nr:hypothetical protein CBS147320_9313 [Aspergillus niger]